MPKTPSKTEPTKRTKPENDDSLKRLLIVTVSGLIALAITWGIVFTLTSGKDKTVNTDTKTAITKEQRSVSGKTINEDKKDATAALNNLLVLADKSPTGANTSDRLQTLEKDNYSVIDEKLPNSIHFGPDATAGMKTSTYQALVTLSSVAKDHNASKKIEPVTTEAWQKAFADPQLGTVFIPLSVYTGNGAAFSLEMVYVDGAWKLSPYSLLDAIRLSAALQNPTASPSATPGN